MSEYPENPGKLPAEKLCNKYNNPNPIKGEGALGNENTGKMYHEGNDRKSLVETLQKMLRDLKKYDIGSSGPNNDGVDGTFGNSTENAVKQFQEEHKDWDGNALKVDGLVGPETADALNREMVDIWYDHYQTPVELVEGVAYHAATVKYLENGLSIDVGNAQKCRVFLVGHIPASDKENVVLEWPDEFTQYLPEDLILELASGDRKMQIPWSSGSVVNEMRRFVFEDVAAKQDCTLMAYGAGRSICLWNNQFVADPDNPPSWEHWLEELFIDRDAIAANEPMP